MVLSDATNEGQFTNDPYIKVKKPKSVLCAPVYGLGKIVAILYLENNISIGAFTQDRLNILNMLSSQAAISLENAALYSNLEEKVEERTLELRLSKKEIDDIFSNVEQGLMTINPDHTMSSEFSQKVVDIFEREDLGGLNFENLFLGNLELQKTLRDFLEQLFTNAFMSMALFERANPLSDYNYKMVNKKNKEVVKILDFKFSRIFKVDQEGKNTSVIQKVMVVVNDKTNEYFLKQELQKKAEEQAGKVEKLYQILQLQPEVFSNFISESNSTLDQVNANLSELGDAPAEN